MNGYWEELVAFTRSLFNADFKNNPYLERAVMTGITRVSKESMFSDLNNLKVVASTSEEYCDSFGFTEEVLAALDEFGLSDRGEEVKRWYDGFIFGSQADIYNPWSILNYLDTGRLGLYWVNTSSNNLVGKLVHSCIIPRVINTRCPHQYRVAVGQRCHRIASLLRLVLAWTSSTDCSVINATVY